MTPVDQLAFARLLKQHRVISGLSQEALAERAGLSHRAISALERGISRTPHLDTVTLLARALGLSPQQHALGTGEQAKNRGR
jgi:transcriptional regulator with XRE-family HTH domain